MATAKIVCGVAVVENGFRQPVEIEIVPASYEAFKDADERLLQRAKPYVADIPFQQLDVLIVDELGKNISGTGMDLNVIGNWRISGGVHKPDFRRVVVLSLTPESLGNGLGIGLADFTTRRFVDEYDDAVTYVNLLTATEPGTVNTFLLRSKAIRKRLKSRCFLRWLASSRVFVELRTRLVWMNCGYRRRCCPKSVRPIS
jgi:hypothetical protein